MHIEKKSIKFYYISIITILILTSASFMFKWVPIEVLRYISIFILLLQIWNEIKSKHQLFLISPLFLLSFSALVFFSFLQGMTLNLHEPVAFSEVLVSIGSDAERYVAAFGCVTLATHILLVFVIKIKIKAEKKIRIKDNQFIYNFFIFFIIILTFVNVYCFYNLPNTLAIMSVPLRHLLPPLQAFMLLLLIRKTFINGERFSLLIVLFFCIIFIGMFAVHEGKTPVLLFTIVILYWMKLTRITIKKIFVCSFIITLVGITGLQLISVMRAPEGSVKMFISESGTTQIKKNIPLLLRAPALKLLYRQTDTIHCLNKVLNVHSEDVFVLSEQFFWLKGLVPRIIWPEKPNLSEGQVYTQKYCRPNNHLNHYSSITLLGQPFIKGGNTGLFLNLGFLIFGLTGITWLTRERFSLSALSVAALSPWLVDMDQNFILYIANATKFFLIILPLIIIVGLSEKNKHIWRFINLLNLREKTK